MTSRSVKSTRVAAADPQAFDDLIVALDARIAEAPMLLDIDDLLTEFDVATSVNVQPVIAEAQAWAAGYSQVVARAGNNEYTVRAHRSQLSRVLMAWDALPWEFDRAAELSAAEAEVAAAERAQAETVAALETAVLASDVNEVLRLRTEVEVVAPQRVEKARLAVLDLQVARAEANADAPTARVGTTKTAVEKAHAAHVAAEQALKDAEKAAVAAGWRHSAAEFAAAKAGEEVTRLRGERDRARAATERSGQERLRSLAGLPPARSVMAGAAS